MPRGRNVLDSGKSHVVVDIYTRWLECAKSYSRRSLTNESDKLPAILGLAAVIAATTEDSKVHSNRFCHRPLLAGRTMLVRGDARMRGGINASCSRFETGPRNAYSLTCKYFQPVDRRCSGRSDSGLSHLGFRSAETEHIILDFIFEVDALVRKRSAMSFFAISATRVLQGSGCSSSENIHAT